MSVSPGDRGYDYIQDGEVVCLLGPHDRLLPGAIERLLDELDRHPEAGGVHPGVRLVSPGGDALPQPYRPESPADALRLWVFPPLAGALVRREAWEAVGGWDHGFEHLGEVDLYIRVARSHGWRRVQETLATRRAPAPAAADLKRACEHAALAERVLGWPDAGFDREQAYVNGHLVAAITALGERLNQAGTRFLVRDLLGVARESSPSRHPDADLLELVEETSLASRQLAAGDRRLGELVEQLRGQKVEGDGLTATLARRDERVRELERRLAAST